MAADPPLACERVRWAVAVMKPAVHSSPGGRAAVAAEAEFTIEAKASCSDGSCGEVRRLTIDPATDTVTTLSSNRDTGGRPGGLSPLTW